MKSKFWLSLGLVLVFSNIVFSQTAKKTITNADLEKYKQARLKAEAEYKEKYKELGMPSPEELEKQRDETKRRNEQTLANMGFSDQIAADDYQGRANFLRNQIYSINAQINVVNSQLANLPLRNNPVIATSGPIYNSGGIITNRSRRQTPQQNTNTGSSVQAARNAAAGMPNPYIGTQLYSTGVKSVVGSQNTSGRRNRNYYGSYPIIAANSGNNAQRDELISRLQYLEQVRVGYLAQWNILVEEARRAGVRVNF